MYRFLLLKSFYGVESSPLAARTEFISDSFVENQPAAKKLLKNKSKFALLQRIFPYT